MERLTSRELKTILCAPVIMSHLRALSSLRVFILTVETYVQMYRTTVFPFGYRDVYW